jgi:hypothetical protein
MWSGTRQPVVSLIGAQPAHTALSTVGAPREPPRPAELIPDVTASETKRAVARRHLGCISSPMATDTKMVHQ